ncbi:MAG: mandelate racemase [Nitrospirales bacterium]|nr:MAG: mandelate racemase [Nitrospirales bacterium]
MVALPPADTRIDRCEVSAYTIPTDMSESDGTYTWDSTTLVVVQIGTRAGTGWGYTYADLATAILIEKTLCSVLKDHDAMSIPECWMTMRRAIRNMGRPGIVSMAIASVDMALWDLKARVLDIPLVRLFGRAQAGVPIYGSGGFTSYTDRQLEEQLGTWSEQGISQVKMKVGHHPEQDLHRVHVARNALQSRTRLFVDANGAYSVKQAQWFAERFAESGVDWFEEPVSSDNLSGLNTIKEHAPASMEIAAGEYGYDLPYFQRMLDAQCVDVLQADASRCGITGFLQVGTLCEVRSIPLSAHCAPSLHLHPACALHPLRHIEYFHDHVRIEEMLFDGAPTPINGRLYPDMSRPGHGLEFKRADAAQFAL